MKSTFLLKKLSLFFILLVLSFCIQNCARCSRQPVEEPVSDSYKKKLISYDEGRVLFDEYTRTNNQVLTKSRHGEPDSRWYWFSLEDMEGYIRYVKENAKKEKWKNPGIRIYMGKYPVHHPVDKMAKPEYAGYQTIFIVATQKQNTDTINVMSRSGDSGENTDIKTIQALNMTNLAPPPKASSVTMQ
ncbi:hypothetical protein HNP38_002430 [Chryseobacterium defluvii]|uniref:Lipoprotein n=1 Tax=Chryseobacterium defluvii TaxID=160396 RepID=A0A840KD82_9FLAO|nr:hypothetical protein [Chryseobacterium defluvii]MBB4807126.1 hypothetical protein [Chryseobacterium defluvii]